MSTPVRVALLWHDTVTSERLARGPVRVGEDLRCDLVLPDVAGVGAAHTLLTPDGEGGWALHLTPDMRGIVERAGRSADLDAAGPISLSAGDWAQIDLGEIGIFLRVGAEPARLPTGAMLTAVEAPMLGSLLGALTAHLGLLIAAFLLYDEAPRLQVMPIDVRETSFQTQAPVKQIEHEMEVESVTEDVAPAPPEEAGKAGERDAPETPPKARDSKPVEGVRKQAALFKSLESGIVQRVMGRKSGFVDRLDDALVGLDDGALTTRGDGGLALKAGNGPGGGGRGLYGVVGGTGFDGQDGRGISTRSRLKRPPRKPPTFRPEPPTLTGGAFCKPKDIQRVVSQRARGIQYCYEKELKTKPEMSGKLMVSWRIGLDGAVAAARVESNTLGSAAVAGCVKRAVERWRFPKPEGGMCQVRYPFVFSAGL